MPLENLERGDIIISNNSPGHVMMVHTAGTKNDDDAKIIHAQGGGKNFHIEKNQREGITTGLIFKTTRAGLSYLYDARYNFVFRPKWQDCGVDDKDAWLETLKDVADTMAAKAEYGKYRAVRLLLGSSTFGSDASARLAKYVGRYKDMKERGASGEKLVKTVTCAEAVVLCYQITTQVKKKGPPLLVDAAHVMPQTLKAYLLLHWKTVNSPS